MKRTTLIPLKNTRLFYKRAANEWTEALPLGNGRIGAMVYGSLASEQIQFNEETLWSGWHNPDADNPACASHLAEMRELLFAGRIAEAEELCAKYLVCRGEGSSGGHGHGNAYGSFETAGRLFIAVTPRLAVDEARDLIIANDYSRELELARGEVRVAYRNWEQHFERIYFVSQEANCFVARLQSDDTFRAHLSYEREGIRLAYSDDGIVMTGGFPGGMDYAGVFKVVTDGVCRADGEGLVVTGARRIDVYASIATTYASPDDPHAAASEAVNAAVATGFDRLRAQTNAFYADLLGRAVIDLGAKQDDGELATDERLERLRSGDRRDLAALTELYWQYGRYLMIASSYDCRLPANLQGLWSEDYDTPWSGDYHININLQMNYWLTETTSLPECGDVLLRYIRFLSDFGRRTARVQYDCGGWVAHTITNPWGFTAPGEGCSWGSFMCAGAWCCEHIWERWLFGKDREFLRRYYPVMKGACEFFMDFLCEDPKTGHLVTAPSNSPENHYIDPLTGRTVAVCAGPTMDTSILRELFANTLDAASELNTDADFAARLQATFDRLAPIRIGRYGQIMEWQEDYEETEPGHRHLSMLYGLHPSNLITRTKTPELAEAARVALARRLSKGSGHTGWSRAWIINFYARLGMGEACGEHLAALLEKSTYPNLFDAHPPFQIDGNFGAVAGVAEMLLQSHDGFIELLPALPADWKRGAFTGLRARGGFTVSAAWEDGRVTGFSLTSECGGSAEVRYGREQFRFTLEAGQTAEVDG